MTVRTRPGATLGTVTLHDGTTGHTLWLRILDTACAHGDRFVGVANRVRNRLLSSDRGPSDRAEVAQLDEVPQLKEPGTRPDAQRPTPRLRPRDLIVQGKGTE